MDRHLNATWFRRLTWNAFASAVPLGFLCGSFLVLVGSAGCGTSSPAASTDAAAAGQATVATYHNDNARTGANTRETLLTPKNVNVLKFGRLARLPVAGSVYAQPLFVPDVSSADGTHDLVIVATQHDQVYGFDAKSYQMVWHTDFLGTGLSTISSADVSCDDINPEIGITSTPVVDTSTATLYVLVRTKETTSEGTRFYQRLHALDVGTGRDKHAPEVITGEGADQGAIHFDPLLNNQRAALLLANNQVYVAWASHCDNGSYRGWMMSFDAATLSRTAVWTPNAAAEESGIWMSGAGPSADVSGDVYLAIGNGANTAILGGEDYGMSVVRLNWPQNGTPVVVDYFTPFNFNSLNDEDADLGASGAVLIPDHNAIVVSKAGTVYLLDSDKLGHWQAGSDNQIVQSFSDMGSFATPAFWNNKVYLGSANNRMQAFGYNPATERMTDAPLSVSGDVLGFPGSTPSISSNGDQNGIVWFIRHDANAVLEAFDAQNLGNRLYSSNLSPARDAAGKAVKFAVPTVAQGQVFVGTQNEVDVYELLK